MKHKINFILGIILFIVVVQVQAQILDETEAELMEQSKTYTMEEAIRDEKYVFSFSFNESTETAMWEGVFYMLQRRFTELDFVLQCFSSGAEIEEYDKQLATKRGEAVKQFLILNGVPENKIKIEVFGNRDTDGWESIGDETLDDRFDRRVEPVFVFKERQEFVNQHLSIETLDDDIDEGEKIFLKIIKPYVEAIKSGNHLQKLPGVGRPSSDEDEFVEQAKSLIKETVKAGTNPKKLGKLIGTYGLGSFIDLFTSNQTSIIAKNRGEMYDVIIEAFTFECFPKYDSSSLHYSESQLFLYYLIRYQIQNLSNHEKYKIRARFIAGKIYNSFSTESKIRRFNTKMNKAHVFSSNMHHFFSQSKYRYKD